MTLAELTNSVEFIVDETGREKVVLDRPAWKEIVATLEKFSALSSRVEAVQGKYAFVPTSSANFARRKREEIEQEK